MLPSKQDPGQPTLSTVKEPRDQQAAQQQDKKVKPKKVDDKLSKGRTSTGSKPDEIILNPMKEFVDKIANIYDEVIKEADVNRDDSHMRDQGTDSLVYVYKKDTPGQDIDNKFSSTFGKEAMRRSGGIQRKNLDLVPRHNQDRKKDTGPYTQQTIVKKIVDEDVDAAFSEAYGKRYKSPWDKIEKAKPGIGKRIDAAAAALKQNADDYQKILDKEAEKKKTNESVNSSGGGGVRGFGNVTGNPDGSEIGSSYVNQNIADADTRDNVLKAQIKAHSDMHSSTNNSKAADQPGADTQDQIMNKPSKKLAKEEAIKEDLRQWFKDKWVRMDTKGNIKGDCAREPGEGKPKCLPVAKARAMDKDDRAAAARRKRREDPVADRPGKGGAPVNVRTEEVNNSLKDQVTFGSYTTKHFDICPTAVKLYSNIENKTNMVHLAVENMMLHDTLFRLEKQVMAIGYSDKDDIKKAEDIADLIMTNAKQMKLENEHSYIKDTHLKAIKDLNTTNEEVEELQEKNKPTNPSLWSRAKALARSKFDVYPSAYANGWAAKWYKSKGGGWKSANEEYIKEENWYTTEPQQDGTHKVTKINNQKNPYNHKVGDTVSKGDHTLRQYTSDGSAYGSQVKKEEVVTEISDTTIGQVNKIRSLYGPKSKTPTAAATLARAVEKVRTKSKVGKRVEENFIDGKNPEDKGDMARHGLKDKSISQLKKIRSSDDASPRKKQLAHWFINMHKKD